MNSRLTSNKAKMLRVEGASALLSCEQGGAVHEIKVPVALLPENIQGGDTVVIKLSTEAQEKEDNYGRMRQLLEELIN